MAEHSKILTAAMRKGCPKTVTKQMLDSFHILKQSLSFSLCLYIPKCNEVFSIITDTSIYDVCGVLCVLREELQ